MDCTKTCPLKRTNGIIALAVSLSAVVSSSVLAGELKNSLEGKVTIPPTTYPEFAAMGDIHQQIGFTFGEAAIAGAVTIGDIEIKKRLARGMNPKKIPRTFRRGGFMNKYGVILVDGSILSDFNMRLKLFGNGLNAGASPLLNESAIFLGLKPREYYSGTELVGTENIGILNGGLTSADSGR